MTTSKNRGSDLRGSGTTFPLSKKPLSPGTVMICDRFRTGLGDHDPHHCYGGEGEWPSPPLLFQKRACFLKGESLFQTRPPIFGSGHSRAVFSGCRFQKGNRCIFAFCFWFECESLLREREGMSVFDQNLKSSNKSSWIGANYAEKSSFFGVVCSNPGWFV